MEATRHYLEHLADAWNHQHPETPLFDQDVTITVPASFDLRRVN
ncbi:sulfate permease [Photobacterium aphoticum]|uniref:Sulfate permease n=1 Tax=Photobacterium aphoticum TaxID=754436 RepID=A0A090QLH3_9GAMM|nr:sulfate permease [Photobacterium aphoticum]